MRKTIEIKHNERPQCDSVVDEDRREALKKLGKYAAYTAPVMLALMLPKKCLAESPCCRDD
jgi:hypothetical protein